MLDLNDTPVLDSDTLTTDRYERGAARKANSQGWGTTDGGLAIVQRFLEETKDNVSSSYDKFEYARSKGRHLKQYEGFTSDVFLLSPYQISLIGLQTGLSSVGRCDLLSKTLFSLGMALESEVFAHLLRNWDSIKAERVRKAVRRLGSISERRKAMNSISKVMGFALEPWTAQERLSAGQWLLDILIEGSVFVLVGDVDRSITITEEALAVSDKLVAKLIAANPALLPLTEPPEPWARPEGMFHGYRVNLVRSHQKAVHKAINGAIKSGRMQPVLDALNSIQNTAWTINPLVRDMVIWAYQNAVKIEGLPPRDDLPVPEFTNDELTGMDEDERRARFRNIADVKKRNRGFIGERLVFETDIATARQLTGTTFWTPVNMDYRGRVYGLCQFQFQRQDYVRAMFLFANGKPIGTEGLYWLKVHVANCGDFDKISKASFEARVKWVDDNLAAILAVASDPKENLWWIKADAPFQFMAACAELAQAIVNPGYVCRLPVSFDGTCSGLQHLAAMTRDEHTSTYVNLTDNEKPQDVYNVVAEKTLQRVTEDLESTSTAMIARICLDVGIGRSLVKRNVMTYSYSSQQFGMGEQHMEDTMEPLRYKVLTKELSKHPYQVPEDTFETKEGVTYTIPGRTAAKYLASRIYRSIEDVVHKPADAMRFLQGIAKALSHEGKPVVWHTPLGLPVVLRYTKTTTERLELFLHDRGVQIMHKAQFQKEAPGIDKNRASNAIAPGFVHSLDACHLQMVVLDANAEGITDIALVHDSFGCLPADAPKFRQLINGAFVKLYGERDVLKDILEEAETQTDDITRLPRLPEYGTLDINSVRDAKYAFA